MQSVQGAYSPIDSFQDDARSDRKSNSETSSGVHVVINTVVGYAEDDSSFSDVILPGVSKLPELLS